MSFKVESSLMESVSKGRKYWVLEGGGLGSLSPYRRYYKRRNSTAKMLKPSNNRKKCIFSLSVQEIVRK